MAKYETSHEEPVITYLVPSLLWLTQSGCNNSRSISLLAAHRLHHTIIIVGQRQAATARAIVAHKKAVDNGSG